MILLQWSSALELGVDIMDEQHQILLDTMNNLNAQILHGKGTSGCATALRRMQEYAELHFADEEALMIESDFLRMEPHKAFHHKFMAETDRFSLTDCDANPEKAMEVLRFLQEWLVDHILGPDVIFARHYKAWLESR